MSRVLSQACSLLIIMNITGIMMIVNVFFMIITSTLSLDSSPTDTPTPTAMATVGIMDINIVLASLVARMHKILFDFTNISRQ